MFFSGAGSLGLCGWKAH